MSQRHNAGAGSRATDLYGDAVGGREASAYKRHPGPPGRCCIVTPRWFVCCTCLLHANGSYRRNNSSSSIIISSSECCSPLPACITDYTDGSPAVPTELLAVDPAVSCNPNPNLEMQLWCCCAIPSLGPRLLLSFDSVVYTQTITEVQQY